MKAGVVVFCSPELLQRAQAWGHSGLVARSLWVSTAETAQIDPDAPNDIDAQWIGPGGVEGPVRLAESLHSLGALDELRVAWVRSPEDDVARQIEAVESLFHEMMAPDQRRYVDVIVPSRRTDATIVRLPPRWVQLRVVAEDRAAPDVFDAGWDLDLDVPLHAALSVIGVLGGIYSDLPWGVGDRADDHHEFRVFNRVVLGAGDAKVAADGFVSSTVPRSSAGDFHPQRFIELNEEQSTELVDEALSYLRGLDFGALAYDGVPTTSMKQPPRLSLQQHVKLFLSFLVFGLLLLGRLRAAKDAVVHSTHDAVDQGYNVGEVDRAKDWGLDIPDFDAQDRLLVSQIEGDLADKKHDLGAAPTTPAAHVWNDLSLLALSLVDGGPRPEGWDAPVSQRRMAALSPEWVQPSAAKPVAASPSELASTYSPLVAVAAVEEACRARPASLSGPTDATGVVVTAQRLATEVNDQDAVRLDEQLGLLSAPEGDSASSLLDRLNGLVVGGAIRSRLDVERWTEFATGEVIGEPLDWASSERRFRKRALLGLAICTGVGALWAILAHWARHLLPVWLTLPIGLGILVALAVIVLLIALAAFFREYNAHIERGRRRLELRRIWRDRTLAAMEAHSRLDNARRILAIWTDILGTIFGLDSPSLAVPARALPAEAPKGIAVAMPVYEPREMDQWLIQAGGQVGWRGRALDDLAARSAESVARDVLKRMYADDGFPGGPLHDLWERRAELWTQYAADLRASISSQVTGRLVGKPTRKVSVISPDASDAVASTLAPFLGALWPGDAEETQSEWDATLDFGIGSEYGSDVPGEVSAAGRVSVKEAPDVCALVGRIQMRRVHAHNAAGTDIADDDAESVK